MISSVLTIIPLFRLGSSGKVFRPGTVILNRNGDTDELLVISSAAIPILSIVDRLVRLLFRRIIPTLDLVPVLWLVVDVLLLLSLAAVLEVLDQGFKRLLDTLDLHFRQ